MSLRLLLPLLLATSRLAGADAAVWRPFSPDSPWNTPIPSDARLDRDSTALIDDLASRGGWYLNIRDWSIPVYFVDADRTPRHDVGDSRPGVYGAGFEFPRRIPIPDDAQASPPVGDHSDNHLSVIDRRLGLEWGMWAARRDATGRWFTGLGAVTDLNGTGVAPPWFAAKRELDSHRARAGGFPLVAGLILVDEIKAGRIEHALAFAYDHCRTGFFVPPASTAQVAQLDAVSSRGIPMGGRIQLDPAWDVENSGLSRSGQIIARALQKYGAYCSDYAGANVLYAENAPAAVAAWQGVLHNEELAQVFTPDFIRAHFRVIDMGNLLPGQNLEVPPPYILSFAVASRPARIDHLERAITIPAGTEKASVTWTLHPAGSRVAIDGRPVDGPGAEIDCARMPALTVTAPDGKVSTWRLRYQIANQRAPAEGSARP